MRCQTFVDIELLVVQWTALALPSSSCSPTKPGIIIFFQRVTDSVILGELEKLAFGDASVISFDQHGVPELVPVVQTSKWFKFRFLHASIFEFLL
jgi:hypothetical protein